MRCIALAQEWRRQGGEVFFITDCKNNELVKKIIQEGFNIFQLEEPFASIDSLITNLESQSTVRKCNWMVLDGYHFNSDYQRSLPTDVFGLMVVDDYMHLHEYHAHILLNQNIYAENFSYNCRSQTRLLLGTDYVMLRSEFTGVKDKTRIIPLTAKNILITLGGADLENHSLSVVKSLMKLEKYRLHIKIVIGPANKNGQEIQQEVDKVCKNKKMPIDIDLIEKANMIELMSWADLAISAGGSTCWELAFMGLPTIVFTIAANQEIVADGIDKAGMAINLGSIDALDDSIFVERMDDIISSIKKRKDMCESGYKLVDGLGTKRIIDAMINY